MSDGAFHAYTGMLVVSALVLSLLAVRGFGQSAFARVVDAVFAAVFLGYAGYLVIAAPEQVLVFYYALLAPIYAVVHAVRNRSRAPRAAAAGRSGMPAGRSGMPAGQPAVTGPFLPPRPPVSDSGQPAPAAYQPDYHPTPGYQTDQSGYAQEFAWTDQSRYPAGSYGDPVGRRPPVEPRPAEVPGYPAPATYAEGNAAYPPPNSYPSPQSNYPAGDAGYPQQNAYPAGETDYPPHLSYPAGDAPQNGYPAGDTSYAPHSSYPAGDAGYPQRNTYPTGDTSYASHSSYPAGDTSYAPQNTYPAGYAPQGADPGYPMESPGNFPEAGHRADEPWYRPVDTEAAPPATAAPGRRHADEPADPDRTAEWPRYQQ